MYEMMITAYDEENFRANKANAEKVFEYTILDNEFKQTETGLCTNVRRHYDPCYDCNEVSFIDINTRQIITIQQFYVKMKEVNFDD